MDHVAHADSMLHAALSPRGLAATLDLPMHSCTVRCGQGSGPVLVDGHARLKTKTYLAQTDRGGAGDTLPHPG